RRQRDRMAGDILERGQSRLVSALRGKIALGTEAGRLAMKPGDDADLAVTGKIVETCGEAGDADRDVARCDRDGDRLAGAEIRELDLEILGREIAALQRDIDRSRRAHFQNANFDRLGLRAGR